MSEAAAFLQCEQLRAGGLAHAFFTREGGCSSGVYATLNGGVGSRDDAACVIENRARMAGALGVAPGNLLVPYQIHSADAACVEAAWPESERPRVDGLATRTRGIALGVTGADCGMILFSDAQAQVIGACHAGWKGALGGVLEATLDAMERLGASRARTTAVLGPTIGPRSYEVGAEFRVRFLEAGALHGSFFALSQRDGHYMFDLPGFIGMRLRGAGVGLFHDIGLDTYVDEARFYSYRRSVHRNEADYGRLISAIALV